MTHTRLILGLSSYFGSDDKGEKKIPKGMMTSQWETELLGHSTMDIWVRWFFTIQGYSMHRGVLRSISGLYPLDASSVQPVASPNCHNQRHLQTVPDVSRGGVGCAELRAKAVVSWCTRESHWVTLTGPHPQVVRQALQSCITHETARAARKYFYTSLSPDHLLDKQSLRWLVMTLSTLQNKEWSYVDYFINPCKDFFKSSQLNG